ncbi:PROTEIN C09E7.6 [Phytophthora cinnamomi]|uniref:PROTEIN C09E7.6 n=1 Tax=Phytophthora cinnamomi TaxID=4785 RepID=UPI003559A592|nr:PROTEIN C09E7.6 [Phytophthora cinnamomi]
MATDSNSPMQLQRHPKCSALYASRVRRNSRVAAPEPLAASVAYLANVAVEVTTKTLNRDASTFALTVHDRKSSSTWRHLRSYADCRAFQARVLQALSRGHLCFAECPWLFAYVQRALPTERPAHHLLRVAGHGPKPRVVENRRQALAKLFATLQRVLLNPLNQKCTVLMQQVAPEVMTFITNRSEDAGKESLNSPTNDRPLAKTFSESFMFEIDEHEEAVAADVDADATYGQASTATTASLDDLEEESPLEEEVEATAALEKVVAGQRVCCAMCALHKSRSDEQVFACWRAETMSSRFMRLRAGAGAERVSIVAKRQQTPSQAEQETQQVKAVWESPTYSQRVTSPLESMAVLGGRGSDVVVVEHDGTPKDPFPGSPSTPGTPPRDSVTSSRSSSVCEIDLAMLDSWNLSGPAPKSKPASAPASKSSPSAGLENIRRMPRRSLVVLNSLRSKFSTRKNCMGVAI